MLMGVEPLYVMSLRLRSQDWGNMRGFMTTLAKNDDKVFAMDFWLVSTALGSKLCRVTTIDYTGNSCYETMVLPPNKIID